MRKLAIVVGLIAVGILLASGAMAAETTVDSISQNGGTNNDATYRLNGDSQDWQHNDAYSVAFAAEHDSQVADMLLCLCQDYSSTLALAQIETDATGKLTLWESFSTLDDTATAALSNDTWYLICLRSSGSAYSLSYYDENGSLIERLTGVDSASSFTATVDLAHIFGAAYYGVDGSINEEWAGETALHALWGLEDIGEAGCDAWALDPLGYSITTNPAAYLYDTDAAGDITVATTVQDLSGSARHMTLSGDAAKADAGGPTVGQALSGGVLSGPFGGPLVGPLR